MPGHRGFGGLLKSVAYEFKRTTTRTQEYNRAQREANHPSNAQIHFAFPEFQTDPNGTTRPTDYDRGIQVTNLKCATPLALVILLIKKKGGSTITCTRRVGLPVGHGPGCHLPQLNSIVLIPKPRLSLHNHRAVTARPQARPVSDKMRSDQPL
jgi:hypothetical protein